MENFKKYFLTSLVLCTGLYANFVCADEEINTQKIENEKKEVPHVTLPASKEISDQNKQIIPAAPVNQKENQNIPNTETTNKEELAQVQAQNTEPKFSSDELINLPREKRVEYLTQKIENLFFEFNKEEKEQLIKILASWIIEEWTKKEKGNFTYENLEPLCTKMNKYLKNKKFAKTCKKTPDLLDIYKPFFIETLCPEFENALKGVKLNETKFSISKKDENSEFHFFSYTSSCISEETCQEVATEEVKEFKELPVEKQLFILTYWLVSEWMLDLSEI